jgi:transposase
MPAERVPVKPTTRRYSDQEKVQAVRLVRQLRAELGTDHGTVYRVASQLGYGIESVRSWVRQADIDEGVTPGTTTADAERLKALEQEVRELRRANAILKSASAFFAAELDRSRRVRRGLLGDIRCADGGGC